MAVPHHIQSKTLHLPAKLHHNCMFWYDFRWTAVLFPQLLPVPVLPAAFAVELLLMRPTVFWDLKDHLFFSGISSILGAGLCLIGIKHTLQQCMEIEK